MLDRTSLYTPLLPLQIPLSNGRSFTPRPITGRSTAPAEVSYPRVVPVDGNACRGMSQSQRAVFAHDLRNGATVPVKPTIAVVTAVAKVSPEYIRQASKLDDADRAQVRSGSLTLRQARPVNGHASERIAKSA
jgi:hypothetical protein